MIFDESLSTLDEKTLRYMLDRQLESCLNGIIEGRTILPTGNAAMADSIVRELERRGCHD